MTVPAQPNVEVPAAVYAAGAALMTVDARFSGRPHSKVRLEVKFVEGTPANDDITLVIVKRQAKGVRVSAVGVK